MPLNTPDNISTSTNSGPQQGSGTAGITHITGEGAFNFSGGDNTMPNSSSTSFKDLIDIGFRKTLESIGFMRVVVERIEQKQNITIDYIKEALAGNKVMHEKIDDLRKTLSKIEDDKRKSTMSEDMKRREEELEKLTKPSLVSGRESFDGSSEGKSSNLWYLVLPLAAAVMGQVLHMAPQIRGFLEFIKGTEKLISGLSSGASGAASGVGAGTAAATKFSSIFNAGKAGLMSTVSNYASGLARASTQNLLKWLNKLKFAARSIIVLDALFTIVYAKATADDPQGAENAFARAFGKIAGGTGGAWILGSLCTLMVGWVPFVGPVISIGAAILGGYYGTIIGEDFGRALYKLFASDFKDFSGFYNIWRRIESDLMSALDSIIPSTGSSSTPAGESGAGGKSTPVKPSAGETPVRPSVGGTPTPSTGGMITPSSGGGRVEGSGGYSGRGSGPVGIDPKIDNAHDRVARGAGVPINLMRTIGEIENSNKAEGSTGSYNGLYQLKGSSDLEYQIQKMTSNILYYKKVFKGYIGREPSGPEIYMTHQQGPLGGPSLTYAYYNGMQGDLAAVGMSKASAKLGTPLSVDTFVRNIKGNLRWSKPLRDICQEWDKKMPDSVRAQIQASYPKNEWTRRMHDWANLQAAKFTVTVKDFYEGFVYGVGSRMEKYNQKDPTGTGTSPAPASSPTPSTGGGKAPVSAGMTPVSYSPSSYSGSGGGGSSKSRYEGTDVDTSGYSNVPSYGDGGKNTYAEGTRYDKTLDKNHPALDILVSQMYKKGHIPSGSVVSFNDKHHAKKSETNAHRHGLAVDISQAGGSQQTRNALIGAIKSCGLEYGVNIAAEDHTFAVGAQSTGQHVHAYFRSRQDADTFLTNWLKKNGVKGKSSKLSDSSPEIIAANPSSGSTLMAYGMGSQQPKVVQVTQPVIVQGGGSSGGGRKGGGTSGAIPSSFNPSNRDILNAYL